jgi:hypothetical protein
MTCPEVCGEHLATRSLGVSSTLAKRLDEDHLFPAMTQRAAAPGSGFVFGEDLVAGLLGHGAPG